eukprot:507802-Pelagomonas_calceolata.AAC.6
MLLGDGVLGQDRGLRGQPVCTSGGGGVQAPVLVVKGARGDERGREVEGACARPGPAMWWERVCSDDGGRVVERARGDDGGKEVEGARAHPGPPIWWERACANEGVVVKGAGGDDGGRADGGATCRRECGGGAVRGVGTKGQRGLDYREGLEGCFAGTLELTCAEWYERGWRRL